MASMPATPRFEQVPVDGACGHMARISGLVSDEIPIFTPPSHFLSQSLLDAFFLYMYSH